MRPQPVAGQPDATPAEPQGRHLIYRAHFDRMNALLGYLTEHCCGGQACEVVPPACTDCGDPA